MPKTQIILWDNVGNLNVGDDVILHLADGTTVRKNIKRVSPNQVELTGGRTYTRDNVRYITSIRAVDPSVLMLPTESAVMHLLESGDVYRRIPDVVAAEVVYGVPYEKILDEAKSVVEITRQRVEAGQPEQFVTYVAPVWLERIIDGLTIEVVDVTNVESPSDAQRIEHRILSSMQKFFDGELTLPTNVFSEIAVEVDLSEAISRRKVRSPFLKDTHRPAPAYMLKERGIIPDTIASMLDVAYGQLVGLIKRNPIDVMALVGPTSDALADAVDRLEKSGCKLTHEGTNALKRSIAYLLTGSMERQTPYQAKLHNIPTIHADLRKWPKSRKGKTEYFLKIRDFSEMTIKLLGSSDDAKDIADSIQDNLLRIKNPKDDTARVRLAQAFERASDHLRNRQHKWDAELFAWIDKRTGRVAAWRPQDMHTITLKNRYDLGEPVI